MVARSARAAPYSPHLLHHPPVVQLARGQGAGWPPTQASLLHDRGAFGEVFGPARLSVTLEGLLTGSPCRGHRAKAQGCRSTPPGNFTTGPPSKRALGSHSKAPRRHQPGHQHTPGRWPHVQDAPRGRYNNLPPQSASVSPAAVSFASTLLAPLRVNRPPPQVSVSTNGTHLHPEVWIRHTRLPVRPLAQPVRRRNSQTRRHRPPR